MTIITDILNKHFFKGRLDNFTVNNFILYFLGITTYGVCLILDLPTISSRAEAAIMLLLLLFAFPVRKTRLAYLLVIPALVLHHWLLFSLYSVPVVKPEHIVLYIFFVGMIYAPPTPDIYFPLAASATIAYHFVINTPEPIDTIIAGKIIGTLLLAVVMVAYVHLSRKLIAERNRFYQASIIDSLTGLYTFSHSVKLGQEMLSAGKMITIILIDLNNFKNINDTYGHLVGNQVLIQFARNLRDAAGKDAVIGRLGGDEFIMQLVKNKRNKKSPNQIILQLKSKTYTADSELIPIHVGFSSGIAESPGTATIEELIHAADRAMYCDKLAQDTAWKIGVSEAGVTGRLQEIIRVLSQKDMYTYVHSLHVAEYGAALAKNIGFSPAAVEEIRLAGWLHDIGKLAIPNEILRKPCKLTSDEYQTIKNHVEDGLNLLRTTSLTDIAAGAIAYHHEHYDGSGYPYGLSHEEIPLPGRILAIADAFSAMTVRRLYRHQSTCEEALQELILQKGLQFDPELVDHFADLFASPTYCQEESTAAFKPMSTLQ